MKKIGKTRLRLLKNSESYNDCGNPKLHNTNEEKQKGVDGKVCWKGYKRMGTKKKVARL